MNTSDSSLQAIEAHEVPDDERTHILPKHFGRHILSVEYAIYTFMAELAASYSGAFWKFIELSNGGFYMTPLGQATFEICVEGNGFEGVMSADAAGITACLFAFSHLSFQIPDERIANHFHQLRDFALEHAEASLILSAID